MRTWSPATHGTHGAVSGATAAELACGLVIFSGTGSAAMRQNDTNDGRRKPKRKCMGLSLTASRRLSRWF